MDKQSIEKIIELNEQANPLRVGERIYSYKNLELVKEPLQAPLEIHSLNGLLDYILNNKDKKNLDELLIHVVDYHCVNVYAKLNSDMVRPLLVSAKYDRDITPFRFNTYLDHEEFIIGLITKFHRQEGNNKLVKENDYLMFDEFFKTVSTIAIEDSSTRADNSFSSAATISKGVVKNYNIKSVVVLRPYRSFSEIIPPESQFIFRTRKRDDEIQCSLFECDGGEWISQTRRAIKDYITKGLGDLAEKVFILA